MTGLFYNLYNEYKPFIRLKDMNQKKRVENLKSAYQSMDEERRKKMELIANGLLNVQMLAGEERPKSWAEKGAEKVSDAF